MCGKINKVLCYFHNRNPIVKLKLVRSCCSDFYGIVCYGTWLNRRLKMSVLHGTKD